MKEKIYTIPVNEAYDTDCECPVCVLEKNLEDEALAYTLGAAMMEEDFRRHSDENGFCNRHFSMLFARKNKLPLALILDTHMQEVRKRFAALAKHAPKEGARGGLFKKKDGFSARVSECIDGIEKGCIVCEKMNRTMERYVDVLLYMWANDEEFRAKFDRSKGLCLKHLKLLAENADKSIGSKAPDFLGTLIRKEEKELDRIQEDIHRFTQKFDYRNNNMEWGTAKDAPVRTIEKLSGYIAGEE